MRGRLKNLPFSFLQYLYINKQYVIMKPEHKEKLLSNLEGIENSSKMIQMMLDGTKPASQQTALELTRKIERLLELSRTIVDLA